MHFFVARLFSIAVITKTYVGHVRNLRPINRLIYYTVYTYGDENQATPMCNAYVNAKSYCRLTPPPQGTPANIRMNLILPETRERTNICVADDMIYIY